MDSSITGKCYVTADASVLVLGSQCGLRHLMLHHSAVAA